MPWNLDYRERNALEKELEQLPVLHRLAFAALMCERLLPNYIAYAKAGGRGNPTLLRLALNEVWEFIQKKSIDAETVRQLIQDCQGLPPDEDDDGTYMYEASMTHTAILYILSACLEPTPHNVAKIALLVGDLLFEFITIEHEIANQDWSRNKSFYEQIKEVANHPLWIRELARQNNELQQLKDVKTLDKNFIECLRTSFDNGDDSLIDLSSIQYQI